MKKINSIGISNGVAFATLRIIKNTSDSFKDVEFTTIDNEWSIFKKAQEQAIQDFASLTKKMEKGINADLAPLFETHAFMAEDPDFEDAVREEIEGLLPASIAVLNAGKKIAKLFESMDNEYMRQRGLDIKEVAQKIAENTSNSSGDMFSFTTPVIIVADDLTSSQTVMLNKEFVKGFILYNGTKNSHTGIFARNLGIPAAINPSEKIPDNADGKLAFLNGETGEIIIEPDNETKEKCQKIIEDEAFRLSELQKYKDIPTVTKDGRKIKLFCNIGSPKDVKEVIENGGEGVGLFRSELLYLGKTNYPSEDEQFESYSQALKLLPEKEVIIRTCDIGSDKMVDYFELPSEQNPALGTRAIRICLDKKDMFKTQLRALYRASIYGKLSIMFPMISSVWELDEAKEIIQEVKDELTNEGVIYDDKVKVGIMIETPAAAIISDELARIADFFSIGSNDLAQYTLACDRNSQLGRFFNPRHEAVLKLIKMVTINAHKAGIPVGICGELGADEDLIEFFLDIGIDELSVSPRKVMTLRKKLLAYRKGVY